MFAEKTFMMLRLLIMIIFSLHQQNKQFFSFSGDVKCLKRNANIENLQLMKDIQSAEKLFERLRLFIIRELIPNAVL